VSDELTLADVMVATKPKEREETATCHIPPFHVILENDDYHTMEFVVNVLLKVLGCSVQRAAQLTLQAHHTGRSIVWTGTKEVAELKVEQIRSFHEIRRADGVKLGPLGCAIEPAPGG